MSLLQPYGNQTLRGSEVVQLSGATLLEFGVDWCEYCQAAQPLIGAALKAYPEIRHLKIEDGKGRPLGRQFNVKLWPTLILLHDGKEVTRLVRPVRTDEIGRAVLSVKSL